MKFISRIKIRIRIRRTLKFTSIHKSNCVLKCEYKRFKITLSDKKETIALKRDSLSFPKASSLHCLIFHAQITFKSQRGTKESRSVWFRDICENVRADSWRISWGKIFPVSRKFISTVFDPKELNRASNAAAENPPPPSPLPLPLFVRSINRMNLTNVFCNL